MLPSGLNIRRRSKETRNTWRCTSILRSSRKLPPKHISPEVSKLLNDIRAATASSAASAWRCLHELDSEGLSGRLYAESLGNVLAVHLLRYYAIPTLAASDFHGGLSATKLRQVTDFIAR